MLLADRCLECAAFRGLKDKRASVDSLQVRNYQSNSAPRLHVDVRRARKHPAGVPVFYGPEIEFLA